MQKRDKIEIGVENSRIDQTLKIVKKLLYPRRLLQDCDVTYHKNNQVIDVYRNA